MLDLMKLIPDGAGVIAVIIVVIIFLKHQTEYNNSLKEITKTFTERTVDMQHQFELQVDRLSTNYLASEKIYQIQIQRLFDDFILISKETIVAVKELEASVRSLKEMINNNNNHK